MKAYEMDDEPTLYAGDNAEEAAAAYLADSGFPVEDGYPRELTDAELDIPLMKFDEDECPTGETTSVREWLADAKCSGFLAGVG